MAPVPVFRAACDPRQRQACDVSILRCPGLPAEIVRTAKRLNKGVPEDQKLLSHVMPPRRFDGVQLGQPSRIRVLTPGQLRTLRVLRRMNIGASSADASTGKTLNPLLCILPAIFLFRLPGLRSPLRRTAGKQSAEMLAATLSSAMSGCGNSTAGSDGVRRTKHLSILVNMLDSASSQQPQKTSESDRGRWPRRNYGSIRASRCVNHNHRTAGPSPVFS